MIFIMIVVTITGIFMAIKNLLIYNLGSLYISNSGSADVFVLLSMFGSAIYLRSKPYLVKISSDIVTEYCYTN